MFFHEVSMFYGHDFWEFEVATQLTNVCMQGVSLLPSMQVVSLLPIMQVVSPLEKPRGVKECICNR